MKSLVMRATTSTGIWTMASQILVTALSIFEITAIQFCLIETMKKKVGSQIQ
jgi:hypothetical protein